MTEYKPILAFNSPFISEGIPSLADVLAQLETVEGLSPTRRRDLRSALTSIARLIGRRAEEVPANLNWLRIRVRRIHPAAHDLSKKRWSNIRSDALKALEVTGCSRMRADWLCPPSPAWQALLDRIADKHDLWKLTQLAQYCSALGIEPEDVRDAHIRGLTETLVRESFVNRPEHVAVNAVKTWNRLRREVPGWPDIVLTAPRKREPWTFKLATFPESFQGDVAGWLDHLADPDPLSDTGPVKPLRPTTIEHRRFQIQTMASALVRRGHDADKITSLAYLVGIANFKDGLRFLLDRFDGKPTEAIHGLAMGLKAIAQHHVKVDEEHLDTMRQICKRLNRETDGLREKNRKRLQQFDDDHNLARLLHLPSELVRASTRPGVRKHKAALLIQAAISIEILLFAPMRIGNLVALDLERHFRRTRVGRENRVQIQIPGEEVKNEKPLHYELGAETTKLLDLYLAEARPVLLRTPSDFLFPTQDGGHKRPMHLSGLIKETIREHAGLDVNAHLFRSIAAKLHNRAAPGDLVTISHVIGDRIQTVMRAYSQFEQSTSLTYYQRSVEVARSQLPAGRKVRRRRS